MKIDPHTGLHLLIVYSTLVPLSTQQPAVAALREHLRPSATVAFTAGGAHSHGSQPSTLQRTASRHHLLYNGPAPSLIVVTQKALDVDLYCPE